MDSPNLEPRTSNPLRRQPCACTSCNTRVNPETGSPVPGYLIQTDDGKNILVDTGFGEDVVGAYKQPDPEVRWHVDEEDYVVNRLAAIGLTPKDIDYLVATHLDVDHAGAHDLFPDAEIVVQKEHLETARQHPRFDSTRAHWDAPGLTYRTVEGDTELAPGVELIESGGHVPGHQAVLVRLPETGPVLLTIDAINPPARPIRRPAPSAPTTWTRQHPRQHPQTDGSCPPRGRHPRHPRPRPGPVENPQALPELLHVEGQR